MISLFYFSVTKWSYRLPQIAEDDSHLWIDINSQFSKNKKSILWWSWQGSNLRPPECKSGALPTELQPQKKFMAVDQVGLRGLEPRTSSLSGMRSNHLSYKPKNIWYEWSQGSEFDHIPIKDRDFSLERRWSSRTFRYGYLVTTSPQLPVLP